MDVNNLWTLVWKNTFDGAEDRKYKIEKLCCLINGESPYKVPVIRGGNTFNINLDDLSNLQDSDMIIGYDEDTKQNYLVPGSLVTKDTDFLPKPLDIIKVNDNAIAGMFPYKGYKAVLTIGFEIYTLDNDDGLVLVEDLTSGLSGYGSKIRNMFEYNGTYYAIVQAATYNHSILSSVDLVSWDYLGSINYYRNTINLFHVQEYDGKLQFTIECFREKLVVLTYDGTDLSEKLSVDTFMNSIMRGNNVLYQPSGSNNSKSIYELTPDGTTTALASGSSTLRGIAPITDDTYLVNATDTFTYPSTITENVYDFKPQEGTCGGISTPVLTHTIVRMGESDKYFWNLGPSSVPLSGLSASVLDGTDHKFFAGEGDLLDVHTYHFGYMFDNNKFYIGSSALYRVEMT